MNIELVRGFGKCVECGKMTSYCVWFNKLDFYICKSCIQNLYYKSYDFCIKNNEAFKLKEIENQTKELIKRRTPLQ